MVIISFRTGSFFISISRFFLLDSVMNWRGKDVFLSEKDAIVAWWREGYIRASGVKLDTTWQAWKNRTSGYEEGYPKAPWKILRACPDVWKQTWQKLDTTQNTNASYDINLNTVWSLKLLTSSSSTPWVINACNRISIMFLYVYICLSPILLQIKQISNIFLQIPSAAALKVQAVPGHLWLWLHWT